MISRARAVSFAASPEAGALNRIAHDIYRKMWQRNKADLAAGRVKVDPLLIDPSSDARHGLNLVARFSPRSLAVIEDKIMAPLRKAAPGQYFHPQADMHLTIMTFITGNTAFQEEAAFGSFAEKAAGLFEGRREIPLRFFGVSATTDAVLLTGYFIDTALDDFRKEVGQLWAKEGLAERFQGLRYYPYQTVHSSVMRFVTPPDGRQLVKTLEALKRVDLGVLTLERVEFTISNWYMKRNLIKILKAVALASTPVQTPPLLLRRPGEIPPQLEALCHGGGPITFRRLFSPDQLAGGIKFIDYTEIPPGSEIGLHPHTNDEEVYFIVRGDGEMHVDGKIRKVQAGDTILTRSGSYHGLKNTGPENLVIFVVAGEIKNA